MKLVVRILQHEDEDRAINLTLKSDGLKDTTPLSPGRMTIQFVSIEDVPPDTTLSTIIGLLPRMTREDDTTTS